MRGVLLNSSAMLSARLIAPIASLVINVALARAGGREMLGAYAELMSVLVILQTAAGAGFVALLARDISAHPERAAAQLGVARGLGAGTATLAICALGGFAAALSFAAPVAAVALVPLAIAPSAWIAVQEAYFIATNSHWRIAVISLVENSIRVGVAAAAIVAGMGIVGVCCGIVLGRAAALGVGLLYLERDGICRAWRPQFAGVPALARSLAPFAALLTLSMIYFRVDVLLVGALRGAADTGVYAAALTIYATALLLPEAALAAVYPRLAASYSRSPERYVDVAIKCALLLVVAMLPVTAIVILLARPLLEIVYGEHFVNGVVALQLLALSLPLHALNGALGHALQAGHLQAVVLKIVTTTLVAHIALNLALVPIYGIPGAPIALILSSTIAAVGNLLAFQRRVWPVASTPTALRSTS